LKIKKTLIEPLFEISIERTCFGIDPGTTNLGLAKIYFNQIHAYQITLERKGSAMSRMLEVQSALSQTVGWFGYNPIAIIEGAAYSKHFRQVELAEVRAAMALWFHSRGVEVHFANPQTVRKKLFGSAKIINPWKELGIQNDVAAAISCAYFASSVITGL
jgi:hypothetical protein